MDIALSRLELRRILLAALWFCAGAGVLVEVARFERWKTIASLRPLLSLSYEQNVPTWYSAILLFTCSLCLGWVAAGTRLMKGRFVAHWWGLCGGFAYMSLDEVVEIHEHLAGLVRVKGISYLYFSWVIPAALVVLVVGLLYLRFIIHLPARTRLRFVIAGAIYVGGALAMELPLGYVAVRSGEESLLYGLVDALEETMEILGVTLFLLALLEYAAEQGFRLVVGQGSAALEGGESRAEASVDSVDEDGADEGAGS